ncbi:MAG TPA: DUF3365 domain-containing protein [Planctomycetaceae bacterium]|nr:DUF3365 domain-containing protein [Planctomycetaceae bacterium]
MRKALFSIASVVPFFATNLAVVAADHTSPLTNEAINRARKQVRMLDDVYKTTVVLITDKYVNNENDFPFGSAAVELFKQISKKGWHDVRLLDATGKPTTEANVAGDDFEREGIKRLRSGQDYVDRVEQRDGKHYLRAMTPIPVVMKKCIMCHAHYADAKKGQPIGALSYRIEIE